MWKNTCCILTNKPNCPLSSRMQSWWACIHVEIWLPAHCACSRPNRSFRLCAVWAAATTSSLRNLLKMHRVSALPATEHTRRVYSNHTALQLLQQPSGIEPVIRPTPWFMICFLIFQCLIQSLKRKQSFLLLTNYLQKLPFRQIKSFQRTVNKTLHPFIWSLVYKRLHIALFHTDRWYVPSSCANVVVEWWYDNAKRGDTVILCLCSNAVEIRSVLLNALWTIS